MITKKIEEKLNRESQGHALHYYDKDGNPIGLGTWARLFEDYAYRYVALDELPTGFTVSTVWLGLDQSFGSGPPIIFETMVFPDGAEQERYSTLTQAIKGHKAMVKKWAKVTRAVAPQS